ncbi:MAG: hypothetical protein K0R94_813, partial [Burkholderiales bacterium]|nr:hypothetical protein [Burkholderiales bacterium]
MKLVIQVVLLFIIAIVISTLSNYGSGHAILLIGKYRVDLSLITLLLVILMIYIISHYLFIMMGSIYNLPSKIKQRSHKISLIKSRNYFNTAATNYFLDDYQKAYTEALK